MAVPANYESPINHNILLAYFLFGSNDQEDDMVSRVKRSYDASKRISAVRRGARIVLETVIVLAVVGVFLLKIFAYTDPAALTPSAVVRAASTTFRNSVSFVDNLPFLNSCPRELRMQDVSGGYVCVSGSANGDYNAIYKSYPLVGRGRESIYTSTDKGSVAAANDLLHNQFDIPRYSPVRLPALPTWSENAYSAAYWRLEFYSLRPSLDLLYAFRTTGKATYAHKLISLDLSFISAEKSSKWAWSDPRAAALRSIALVDTWWKLRQAHQLPESASNAILGELENTGQFLSDSNHYQTENNNCISEAAALYELAVAFPTLPNSHNWLELATQRLQWQLNGLVDADGQLVQNSTYYDFDALTKYWQIYKYSVAQGSPVSGNFQSKLASMINFAEYVLQPNSEIPLLGSSVELSVADHGVYAKMAAAYPQLLYVLSHGARGTVPANPDAYFAASGLTVMRSAWGSGTDFARSTYLTYNIGRYRTAYSSLDALAVTLYGDGGELLPGAGLYTYQRGAYRDYFHGTSSQNTVVVDGKSQSQGNGTGTALTTTDSMTYQSAESSLYDGVTHRRLVMMIDSSHLLVVDRLNSSAAHKYQQMFHLFPGATLSRSGLTVSGVGGAPRREIKIQQLLPNGITESDVINRRGSSPAGLCAEQYGKLMPCHQISYTQYGRNATFITLLTIGTSPQTGFGIKVAAGGQQLQVIDGGRRVGLNLGESEARPAQARASDPTPPAVTVTPVKASSVPANWTAVGPGRLSFGHARTDGNQPFVSLSTDSGATSYIQNDAIRLNLAHHNVRLRLKINGFVRLGAVRLTLGNGNWASSVTTSLLHAYSKTNEGSWVDLFVGPSSKWGANGGWEPSEPGFDWSKIDGIRITLRSQDSSVQRSAVSVEGLSLIPAQNGAKLVFVFDDGYESILPAASYLHRNNMEGNVAVIGKYVDYPTQNHLNLYQLKALQNNWGWDMVNHTQQHANAVITYSDQNNLTGYTTDVLQQAAWLEANGLNSAPNWFIYPHGATSAALERVIGRYYMFARLVINNPDAYPYGDPRAISDLEIEYPGDSGDGGSSGLTSPAQVLSAVRQAMAHNLTLILTFHRIHSEPSDPPGYPLRLFKQIVNDVRQSDIKVLTLSQLDQSNGVTVKNHISYVPARPSQITVSITS